MLADHEEDIYRWRVMIFPRKIRHLPIKLYLLISPSTQIIDMEIVPVSLLYELNYLFINDELSNKYSD